MIQVPLTTIGAPTVDIVENSPDADGNISSSMPGGSASSQSFDLNELYEANRIWAEEQAQKQMDYQTSANKIAMDFASAEADKERAFQTEMANTAWQRSVKDMKAAGLNPILAYSQGGAAVPSVNAASGVSSSGAKASMADTGYTPYQIDYAYRSNAVNNATSVITSVINLLSKIKIKK